MLTELQEKLAEGHALAIAAATTTKKVEKLTSDRGLRLELHAMHGDADDTRARCLALEQRLGGTLGEELLAHVNTTKEKAADLAGAWFKAGTDPLAAWSFLAMGEAAEVAVWSALLVLASKDEDGETLELAAWALPIQRRHLATALSGVVQLAELRDPNGPRWGDGDSV
jgi:hypothetical protein